jgi:hypothetical protein
MRDQLGSLEHAAAAAANPLPPLAAAANPAALDAKANLQYTSQF